MRKFHFASICNVLPCELRLFWYLTRALNQSADCRPTVSRHLANKLPTCCQQSADCWQKIFVKGGKRQLADCRPAVGRQSADCWSTVDRLLVGGAVLHFFPVGCSNVHVAESLGGELLFIIIIIQDIYYCNYKELIKKKLITMF